MVFCINRHKLFLILITLPHTSTIYANSDTIQSNEHNPSQIMPFENFKCSNSNLNFCNAIIAINTALINKQFDKALTLAIHFHNTYPHIILSSTLLGDILRLNHQYQAAQDAYLHAKSIQNSNIAANLGMAELFEQTGDIKSAIESFELVIQQTPNLKALWRLAELYTNDNDRLKVLKQLYTLIPNDENLNLIYIQTLMTTNQIKIAYSVASNAANVLPHSRDILQAYGVTALANRDPLIAAELFNSILNSYPDSPEAETLLGVSLAQIAHTFSEKKEVGQSKNKISLDDIKRLIIETRRAYLKGEFNQAIKLSDQIIAIKNYQWIGYQLKGDIFQQQNIMTRAQEYYERSLIAYPTRLGFYKLNNAMIRNNNLIKSTQLIHDWLLRNPDDFEVQIIQTENLIRRQQYKDALDLLSVMLAIKPNNIESHILIVRTHLLQNNLYAAQAALKNALAIVKEDPLLTALQLNIDFKTNKAPKSLKSLSELYEKNAENNDILFLYASNLAYSHQKTSAKKLLDTLILRAPLLLERQQAQEILHLLQ